MTNCSVNVSILVDSIPTDTTLPWIPSTSILSPTSNGWSIASIKEFIMFPSVCWTANPIINENTAKDANIPNNSIPTVSNARFNPMNHTMPLPINTIIGFPPVTVTDLFTVYLSNTAGIMNFIPILINDVVRSM